MEFLTLSLLWLHFHHSSKEADDIFSKLQSSEVMHANEPLNLILQADYLTAREPAQVKWCCIITTNLPGCNILMDLHLGHLDRHLKTSLRNVGSDITAERVIDVLKQKCTILQGTLPISLLSNSDDDNEAVMIK